MKNNHLNWLFIALISLFLNACLGGGGGSETTTEANPENNTTINTQGVSINLLPISQDAQNTATLTVLLKDAQQVPLSDALIQFSFAEDNNATLNPSNIKTDNSGIAQVTVTDVSGNGGNIQLIAAYENISTRASINFIPANLIDNTKLNSLRLESDVQLLKIGESTTITVTALDKNQQPFSNQTVTLSNDGKATMNPNTGKTNSQGQFKAQVSNTQAENITLRAQVGILGQTLELYFGANLQLTPSLNIANGEAIFQAILKDAKQTPLAGQRLNFRFIGDNAETLSPTQIQTNNDGSATVTVRDVANDGGHAIVSVGQGNLQAQAEVQFLANTGNGSQLSVKSNATALTSNAIANLTALLQDDLGAPLGGQKVRLLVNGIQNNEILTDENGIARFTYTQAAGNADITLQSGIARQNITLYFGAKLTISASQNEAIIATNSGITLTARLSDTNGNSIIGIPINFQLNSGNAQLDTFQSLSDKQGQAQTTLTAIQAGDNSIQAQAENLTAEAINVSFNILPIPSRLMLSSQPSTPISLNGKANLQAKVLDQEGTALADIRVDFSHIGVGNISVTAATTNEQGIANTQFNAGNTSGSSSLFASSNGLTADLDITVKAGAAGTIEIQSIQPDTIGIIGSGIKQSSNINFILKDLQGNPVADGTKISFVLGNTTLGGGEQISTNGSSGSSASANTLNGIASVTLQSGLVAGTVDVIASNGDISTLAQVSIVGGTPDADHLSIGTEFFNIAGGRTLNLENNMTTILGDRFGNVVPTKTPVNFISEGGTIGLSVAGGGFDSTADNGIITTTLRSSAPTTPNLAGLAIGTHLGNVGLNRIVAYTTGSESFRDLNGNGAFDGTDTFTNIGYQDLNNDGNWSADEPITNQGDMSEPYIDANDNNLYDSGELFIDVNGNNIFDGPDGRFQANTTIWNSINILFSAEDNTTITRNDNHLTITLQDQFGNALVSGTKFTASLGEGAEFAQLLGITKYTQADHNGLADVINLNIVGKIPPNLINPQQINVNVEVILTFTPPTNAATGKNFDQIRTESRTVNVVTFIETP